MPWTTPPGAGATVFIWSGYSPAERDRRWNAVREKASKAGFDFIGVVRAVRGVRRRGFAAEVANLGRAKLQSRGQLVARDSRS